MTSMPALTYKKVILDNKILKFTDTDINPQYETTKLSISKSDFEIV